MKNLRRSDSHPCCMPFVKKVIPMKTLLIFSLLWMTGEPNATVAVLRARYGARPDEVSAAIGPAIGGCCYAFGTEHRDAFAARFGNAAATAWRHDTAGPDPGYLELRTLCRLALERAGVATAAITQLGACTAEHPDELHSFRRDGAHAGRQLSYIGWAS